MSYAYLGWLNYDDYESKLLCVATKADYAMDICNRYEMSIISDVKTSWIYPEESADGLWRSNFSGGTGYDYVVQEVVENQVIK